MLQVTLEETVSKNTIYSPQKTASHDKKGIDPNNDGDYNDFGARDWYSTADWESDEDEFYFDVDDDYQGRLLGSGRGLVEVAVEAGLKFKALIQEAIMGFIEAILKAALLAYIFLFYAVMVTGLTAMIAILDIIFLPFVLLFGGERNSDLI